MQSDIDNFNAALATVDAEEAFIPAVAPGTIELQRTNEYYPTQEEYLAAIADAMKQEYRRAFRLSLRGAQRRGNLVEVEHVPGNHHCYGDEIATPYQVRGRNDMRKTERP